MAIRYFSGFEAGLTIGASFAVHIGADNNSYFSLGTTSLSGTEQFTGRYAGQITVAANGEGYISFPVALPATGSLEGTLELLASGWVSVRFKSTGDSGECLGIQSNLASRCLSVRFSASGWQLVDANGANIGAAVGAYDPNRWYEIAVRWDISDTGATALWVDGVELVNTTADQKPTTATAAMGLRPTWA